MAAADMAVWRKQNSDTVAVELVLADGSRVRGNMLLSRDKTIREFFNIGAEGFFDFDCKRDGPLVLAKSSVRSIRRDDAMKNSDQAKIDALAARLVELEKNDPYRFLGVPTNVDGAALHKAYIAKARAYHPDRFVDSELPPEIFEYLNAMARRINAAYEDLSEALASTSKKA